MLKNKLEIIIPTYNRQHLLAKTLAQLLDDKSPVKDLNILVLDNNSSDNTQNYIEEIKKAHSNISYIRNHYNLGIGGNIARALEYASKEYVWLLGDDDIIFLDAWPEVEKAIQKGEKVICAANYNLQKGEEKSIPALLLQMSFVSCNILHTSLFTNTEMANIVNNIYTLFPHIPPIITYINSGHIPYLLPKPLVTNGMKQTTDTSYIRGYDNTALYLKQRSMSWIVGWANVIAQISNKKLRQQCMARSIIEIHGSWGEFNRCIFSWYISKGNFLPVLEVSRVLPFWRKIFLWVSVSIYQQKENNAWYIFFFGIKTKIWISHK